MNKFHYVYLITNIIENKYYIGARSSNIKPELDLGIKYFSSSKDKEFKKDQKENPQNYSYKIFYRFNTKIEALDMEIKLHNFFNVGVDPKFYNRAKQKSKGFDTTGKTGNISCIDNTTGEKLYITTEEFYKNREKYTFHMDNKLCCYDRENKKQVLITTEEYHQNKEKYICNTTGKVTCIDLKTGNKISVSTDEYHENKYLYGSLFEGELNGMFGKVHSDEAKKLMSNKAKEWAKNNPNPMKGRTHTEESNKKIAAKWLDNDNKIQMMKNGLKTHYSKFTDEQKKEYEEYTRDRLINICHKIPKFVNRAYGINRDKILQYYGDIEIFYMEIFSKKYIEERDIFIKLPVISKRTIAWSDQTYRNKKLKERILSYYQKRNPIEKAELRNFYKDKFDKIKSKRPSFMNNGVNFSSEDIIKLFENWENMENEFDKLDEIK